MADEGKRSLRTREVREAYERLMDAFASGAADEYFACFHDDASFLFPGEPLLEPRSAYRSAWSRWAAEGVRFTDVVTDDVRIRVFGDTAVVTHRIATTVDTGGTVAVDRERESIIFARTAGRWLAVHEHLSPADPREPVQE
jgi:uncharacterized protein (TIGR02246 family)